MLKAAWVEELAQRSQLGPLTASAFYALGGGYSRKKARELKFCFFFWRGGLGFRV